MIAILLKKIKPKKSTDKPVAFLFGFSKWKHDFIQQYLNEYIVIFIDDNENYLKIINKVEKYKNKVFMVWGYKDRKRIKRYSKNKNIPFFRVEDGFIRSVQLGASKSIPISLCIDSEVLYYDASESSDLERILSSYDFKQDTELIKLAKESMESLKILNISKYNNVSNKDIESIYGKKEKKRILVIGQVEDDESIKRGCLNKITNNELVILARMENPEAEIFYKPHPDVLFGKRKMYSNPQDVMSIAKVIVEPLSLADALQTIDHVYTITSLSGFEALIRGIHVTTLGAPFYSGWGLTDDRQFINRRGRKLTIEEVFAAAYILYPKYFHPITKREIDIKETIKIISFMRDFEEKKNEPDQISNIDGESINVEIDNTAKIGVLSKGIWAIPNLDSFFKGDLVFNPKSNMDKLSYIAGWGRKPTAKKAIKMALENNLTYLALEDGFIRSIDLGVNGAPTYSICLDNVGIYYDATKPSRLENILNSSGWERESLLQDATKAIELIRNNYLSKYNHAPMANENSIKKKENEDRILVVDQTLGDMSISLGLASKEVFIEMYKQARLENPVAHIYIKTHPDVISGKKQGNLSSIDIDNNTTFIYDDCNPISLLNLMDKVYVVTSQLGFEALLLEKEVHCFGMPFYAGWGITIDRKKLERRVRDRTLTEVFAAAYLLYTRYINPNTGKAGSIFDVINYIVENRNLDLNEAIEYEKVH